MTLFTKHLKFSCTACTRGHRANSCQHFSRVASGSMYLINDRGRPSKDKPQSKAVIRLIHAKISKDNSVCDKSHLYCFQCSPKCCKNKKKFNVLLEEDSLVMETEDGRKITAYDTHELPRSAEDQSREYTVYYASGNGVRKGETVGSSKSAGPATRPRAKQICYVQSDEEDDNISDTDSSLSDLFEDNDEEKEKADTDSSLSELFEDAEEVKEEDDTDSSLSDLLEDDDDDDEEEDDEEIALDEDYIPDQDERSNGDEIVEIINACRSDSNIFSHEYSDSEFSEYVDSDEEVEVQNDQTDSIYQATADDIPTEHENIDVIVVDDDDEEEQEEFQIDDQEYDQFPFQTYAQDKTPQEILDQYVFSTPALDTNSTLVSAEPSLETFNDHQISKQVIDTSDEQYESQFLEFIDQTILANASEANYTSTENDLGIFPGLQL